MLADIFGDADSSTADEPLGFSVNGFYEFPKHIPSAEDLEKLKKFCARNNKKERGPVEAPALFY